MMPSSIVRMEAYNVTNFMQPNRCVLQDHITQKYLLIVIISVISSSERRLWVGNNVVCRAPGNLLTLEDIVVIRSGRTSYLADSYLLKC